ncbi:MAG: helix-turn-helix transcriptional regulator [Gammaproteobacteria bacterium]|nr:helix-turn-helix transcriptional regulator [Gammaproteobacteria bacterium]
MWTGYSAAGFISLFVSCNVVLVGIVAFFRRPAKTSKRDIARIRFSLLLICAGFLLGLFTLFSLGVLSYQGLPKLGHDLTALLFAVLVPDYVRSALQRRSLGRWLAAPPLIYLGAWVVIGEPFYALVDVGHLILFGFCCSGIALVLYLRHLAVMFMKQATWHRIPAIDFFMAALLSVYAVQIVYLFNQELMALYLLAPFLGTLIFGLFFGLFIFTPEAVNVFLRPAFKEPSTANSDVMDRLLESLTAQELYTDIDLNVASMAKALDYAPRQLSSLINAETGKNFTQFINEFRIAKAKELLDDVTERQVSIEAIALLCGFKSRSTFYAAFRRETGMSPGNYRNFKQ